MTDYSQFERGATLYPLPSATTNSLLYDADPVLFYILDYYTYLLNTYLGPRLATQAAAIGITGLFPPAGGAAVNMAIPYDPAPYLTESQLLPPLLGIWRQKETLRGRTVTWRESVTTWGISYILMPLNVSQAEAFLPILNAVSQVLDDRTENGFDPGYTPPGGALGGSPWAMAPVDKIKFLEGSWGHYVATGTNPNIAFPCWTGVLETHERAKPVLSQFGIFQGADVTAQIQPTDGTGPVQASQFSTTPTPTITLVTPNTTPANAASFVVITGSFFEANCTVTVNGVAATAVSTLGSSMVAFTCPALPAGTYAVSLTNPDGTVATISASLTYQ